VTETLRLSPKGKGTGDVFHKEGNPKRTPIVDKLKNGVLSTALGLIPMDSSGKSTGIDQIIKWIRGDLSTANPRGFPPI
jgi:hypothetical protein